MQPLNLKPTHKLVKNYYEVLGQFGQLEIDHEGAVSSAFQNLLAGCGHQFDLTLVREYSFQPSKLHAIRIDGAVLNPFKLAHGYWEPRTSTTIPTRKFAPSSNVAVVAIISLRPSSVATLRRSRKDKLYRW